MAGQVVAVGEMEGIYRSLRTALGVEAFGIAALVLPPGTEQVAHYHEEQDEVYFVHRGQAGFEIARERFELAAGEAVHVASTTPRQFWNRGEEDLTIIAIGGRGGYVDGDARLVDDGDADRIAALMRGDAEAIRRSER